MQNQTTPLPHPKPEFRDSPLTTPTSVQSVSPLLSITIPTYNRAPFLAELLTCLHPQLCRPSIAVQAELIISDNASTDDTPAIVAAFKQRGLSLRYLRNPENLGSDSNFLQCIDLALGKYVWVLGDDDLLTPEAIPQILSMLSQAEQPGSPTPDFDFVYLSSFGFSGAYVQPAAGVLKDKLGRFAEIVTSGPYFLEKVNALIGLISAIIINKQRLLATPHPAIASLRDTNLIQTGWIFPVLHRRCRVLYIWQRLLAYRSFNSIGWGVCEVFGVRLGRIATRYFAAEPDLARALLNGTLRFWLSDKIFSIRTGEENAGMNTEDFRRLLQPTFRRNWRYWVFVWTMATPPLPIIRLLRPILTTVNKLSRAGQVLLRHLLHRGSYLHP
jgi:abequosyltransferase